MERLGRGHTCLLIYSFLKCVFISLGAPGPWLRRAGASIFAVTRGLQSQHVNSYCLTWDPVPRPGIEPRPPSFGAWSLSHWTTEEVPRSHLLKGCTPFILILK